MYEFPFQGLPVEVNEMSEVWDKEKIAKLSEIDKDQWFDVLNHGLEEDIDISLDDPQIKQKQQEIKTDYMKYLESCPDSADFYKYYVYKDHDKIISVCRIVNFKVLMHPLTLIC